MLESCVALGRADPVATAQAVLKNLAEAVGGCYHCYSPEAEVSLLPLPSLPASKVVPGELDQRRSCYDLLPSPLPSSVGSHRSSQVTMNMWEEQGHEVTRDPLVSVYDELITHL